jgi:maleylacetate reductase
MTPFTYDALPGRVVFGAGSRGKLADELGSLGALRILVLSTPEQRDMALETSAPLEGMVVGLFDRAVMHVPIATAQAARDEVSRLRADTVLAIGGGSTIGLAKAIALECNVNIVVVPTTYAGSEMTPIWGITADGLKKTGRDRRVLPNLVIYDPELVIGLPPGITGPSGMNAIAHCIEALYAKDANPIISMIAEEGIRALAGDLERAVREPGDIEARSNTLYGAWLAGTALGAVGMSIHHKLCHTLGGSFNLPHAEVHTVILPHAAAYNADAAAPALTRAARALGVSSPRDVAGALFDLSVKIGAPTKLAAIGMKEEDLDKAADIAVESPYWNPRVIERKAIRQLLDDAFRGRRP